MIDKTAISEIYGTNVKTPYGDEFRYQSQGTAPQLVYGVPNRDTVDKIADMASRGSYVAADWLNNNKYNLDKNLNYNFGYFNTDDGQKTYRQNYRANPLTGKHELTDKFETGNSPEILKRELMAQNKALQEARTKAYANRLNSGYGKKEQYQNITIKDKNGIEYEVRVDSNGNMITNPKRKVDSTTWVNNQSKLLQAANNKDKIALDANTLNTVKQLYDIGQDGLANDVLNYAIKYGRGNLVNLDEYIGDNKKIKANNDFLKLIDLYANLAAVGAIDATKLNNKNLLIPLMIESLNTGTEIPIGNIQPRRNDWIGQHYDNFQNAARPSEFYDTYKDVPYVNKRDDSIIPFWSNYVYDVNQPNIEIKQPYKQQVNNNIVTQVNTPPPQEIVNQQELLNEQTRYTIEKYDLDEKAWFDMQEKIFNDNNGAFSAVGLVEVNGNIVLKILNNNTGEIIDSLLE